MHEAVAGVKILGGVELVTLFTPAHTDRDGWSQLIQFSAGKGTRQLPNVKITMFVFNLFLEGQTKCLDKRHRYLT